MTVTGNFQTDEETVVEITPIGIQSLHWKFYIIWTVFNLAFVPVVYFLYPETSQRSLEDIDRLFRDDQSILIFRNKDAIASGRPAAYLEHHEREMRRNSSVVSANPAAVQERLKAMAKAIEEGAYSHNEKV